MVIYLFDVGLENTVTARGMLHAIAKFSFRMFGRMGLGALEFQRFWSRGEWVELDESDLEVGLMPND